MSSTRGSTSLGGSPALAAHAARARARASWCQGSHRRPGSHRRRRLGVLRHLGGSRAHVDLHHRHGGSRVRVEVHHHHGGSRARVDVHRRRPRPAATGAAGQSPSLHSLHGGSHRRHVNGTLQRRLRRRRALAVNGMLGRRRTGIVGRSMWSLTRSGRRRTMQQPQAGTARAVQPQAHSGFT